MLVKEIMEPVTSNWLQPEQTLFDAICTMRKTRWLEASVNGMVVLEHGIKLVGIVSIKDVVSAVLPTYLEKGLAGFTWSGMLEDQAIKARTILVAEIMSTDLLTVRPDDLLIHCANLLIKRDVQRAPVVDESGRVLGMVHLRDIYQTVTRLMCKEGGDAG